MANLIGPSQQSAFSFMSPSSWFGSSNMNLAPGQWGKLGFYDAGNGNLLSKSFLGGDTVFNPKTGFQMRLNNGWGQGLNMGLNLLGMGLNWMQANKQMKMAREALDFEKQKFEKNFKMMMDAYRRKANHGAAQIAYGRSGGGEQNYYNIGDYYNRGDKYLKGTDYINDSGSGYKRPAMTSAFAQDNQVSPLEKAEPVDPISQMAYTHEGAMMNQGGGGIAGKSAFAPLGSSSEGLATMGDIAGLSAMSGQSQSGTNPMDALNTEKVIKRRRKKMSTSENQQNDYDSSAPKPSEG